MNQFFLLIPAVDENDAEQDIAYLKLLGDISIDDVVHIFKKVKGSLRLIESENYEIVYDHKHLNRLNKVLKEKRGNKSSDEEMPQVENLLLFLNDAKSIQDCNIGKQEAIVNGLQVKEGLINAYVESGIEHNTLLNREALNNELQPVEVVAVGKKYQLKPLVCEAADVYLWLIDSRYPARKFDPNYKKHTENEKLGKRGVKVSPISYTKTQLDIFLKKAVCAGNGSRELYFKDNELDKIIVFWDENLETPSYHAFEIEISDLQEIQKLYKRGGRSLLRRLEETAGL